ncbi:MAG: WG repeat-containing protein [Clostridiales bacterium]|nr:WG repeat-containing protein [Clostridiales bacterium]
MSNKFVFFAIIAIIIGVVISLNTGSSEIEKIELSNEYSYIGNFSDGLAYVVSDKDNKCGYVDENGKIVIPCIYDSANKFSEGLALVKYNGEFSFIDKSGETIISNVDIDDNFGESISYFSNGRALVRRNEKYGYIDKIGEEIIPCQYLLALPFENNFAFVVYENKERAYINTYGDEVITFYDSETQAVPFSEGLAVIEENEEWNVINEYGESVIEYKDGYNIPHILNYLYNDFQDGMILITHNEKAGYMNSQGEIVIPCIYDGGTKFENGKAFVGKDNKILVIDKEGNENKIADNKYIVEGFKDILIVANTKEYGMLVDNEKYGCIDKEGKKILPCEYDEISGFIDGVATAKKDNKWYILKIKD